MEYYCFFGTFFTLFNAKYIKEIGAAQITMIEMLSGILIISCLFIFQQDYSIINTTISLTVFYYLLILAVICTALVFVWMTEIMRHVSPYSLIMAINLEPIYSILLALVFFGENELMRVHSVGSSVIMGIVLKDI